jgi:putative membrane protein
MLFGLLLSWLILAASMWLTAAVLPGIKLKGDFGSVLIVAAIFGVLNLAIGWFFFLVIGIGTLGIGFLLMFITRWIVDAIILKLTDSLTDRLTVKNFGWALAAALVMAGFGTLGEYLLHMFSPGYIPIR